MSAERKKLIKASPWVTPEPRTRKLLRRLGTHIVEPWHLVRLRIGENQAFEVHVGTFLDVVGIKRRAHLERDDGHVCEERRKETFRHSRLGMSFHQTNCCFEIVRIQASWKATAIRTQLWNVLCSEWLHYGSHHWNWNGFLHSTLQRLHAQNKNAHNAKQHLEQRRLTMNNESPFVLDCTIWYEWVLRTTRQVLSVVIHHGNERQDAQWLIACLGKLWNEKWFEN